MPPELITLREFRLAEVSKRRFDLLEAMIKTRNCLSTDNRDKIYALLGLTTDGAELVPVPNYIRPAQSLCFQIFTKIVSEIQKFHVISIFEPTTPSAEQPDWTNLDIGIAHWIIQLIGDAPELPASDWFPFAHYSQLEASQFDDIPRLSESGLQICGRILSPIQSISSSCPLTSNESGTIPETSTVPRPIYVRALYDYKGYDRTSLAAGSALLTFSQGEVIQVIT